METPRSKQPLKNKVAWVTGAGSGIGRAAARMLAAEGCWVALLGNVQADLDKVHREIGSQEQVAEPVLLDITKREDVEKICAELFKGLRKVDILVNCAGISLPVRDLEHMPPEDWDRMIAVNLTGQHTMIQAALPAMRSQGNGLIINVASMGGKQAYAVAGAAYTAAKHALVGLSHQINAEEWRNGIRASVLCPGEVNTPILNQRPVPLPPEDLAQLIQPEDVAEAMCFIAKMHPRTTIPEMLLWPRQQRSTRPAEGSLN